MKFSAPTNVKAVQSYLGLTEYFRKFIPDYSIIARSLTNLLKKNVKFSFDLTVKEAFEKLKSVLMQKPVLNIFVPNSVTELHTDASKWGCGAVLMQLSNEDNSFHPVYYYSRKTLAAEMNYCSYEVLAIVRALQKLRVYLLGIEFTIVTDCAAFKFTMEKKQLPPRVAGWAMILSEFRFRIVHRPGSKMRHVDTLSRFAVVMSISTGVLEQVCIAQESDEKLSMIRKTSVTWPF